MYVIKVKVEVYDSLTNKVVANFDDHKKLSPTQNSVNLAYVVANSIGGPVIRPPKPPKM
jgi:hypothetical protein